MPAIHRPTSIASSALVIDLPASSTTMASPRNISAKYSGELNDSANLASGGATSIRRQHADGAGDEGGDGGNAERRAGASLLRHLVAVEAGDHRGRFSRHVEQDRRRRTAVLGAVINAREHDDRAGGIHLEGQRQQHRNGRRRSQSRQHADHGAEEQPIKHQKRLSGVSATANPCSRPVMTSIVRTPAGRWAGGAEGPGGTPDRNRRHCPRRQPAPLSGAGHTFTATTNSVSSASARRNPSTLSNATLTANAPGDQCAPDSLPVHRRRVWPRPDSRFCTPGPATAPPWRCRTTSGKTRAPDRRGAVFPAPGLADDVRAERSQHRAGDDIALLIIDLHPPPPALGRVSRLAPASPLSAAERFKETAPGLQLQSSA